MSETENLQVEKLYRTRYVAFLDLLGFKALVERAEESDAERIRLTESLDRLRETLCNNPAYDTRFTYFSDCIIVTAERSARGLWELITSLDTLTCNLLQNDVLVRGAITCGGSFHSQEFVYGTAVSRAATIEKCDAKNPLVLLSAEVYADAQAYGQDFLDWLQEDGDGRHFIHFLRRFAEYHDTPPLPGKQVLDDDAARIVYFISNRLVMDVDGVLSKAEWIQAYWNRTVAKADGFVSIVLGVLPERPEGRGSIVVRRLVAR